MQPLGSNKSQPSMCWLWWTEGTTPLSLPYLSLWTYALDFNYMRVEKLILTAFMYVGLTCASENGLKSRLTSFPLFAKWVIAGINELCSCRCLPLLRPLLTCNTLAQRSGMESDHHKNDRSVPIISGYGPDMGGPQKRNPSPRCLRT